MAWIREPLHQRPRRLGPVAFLHQVCERRQLAVTLQQHRPRAEARKREVQKIPDRLAHRGGVGVDQQGIAEVLVGFETGDVDLSHPVPGQGLDVAFGIDAAVAGAQVHVVEVEQETASAAPGDFVQEVRLVHLADEGQVVGRILKQDATPDRTLVPIHPFHQPPHYVAGTGQGQEVREPDPVRPRPDRVLRHQYGLEFLHQALDRRQVPRLGRGRSAKRRADPVEAHRERLPDLSQPREPRSARHHVVLGMDFEPQRGPALRECALDVGLLEAEPGADCTGGADWAGGAD